MASPLWTADQNKDLWLKKLVMPLVDSAITNGYSGLSPIDASPVDLHEWINDSALLSEFSDRSPARLEIIEIIYDDEPARTDLVIER